MGPLVNGCALGRRSGAPRQLTAGCGQIQIEYHLFTGTLYDKSDGTSTRVETRTKDKGQIVVVEVTSAAAEAIFVSISQVVLGVNRDDCPLGSTVLAVEPPAWLCAQVQSPFILGGLQRVEPHRESLQSKCHPKLYVIFGTVIW